MKYIVYWILSWTAYVECPPQVDEFGRTTTFQLIQTCTEKRSKQLSREFDSIESAAEFFGKAVQEKNKKRWEVYMSGTNEHIDTVWMESVKLDAISFGTLSIDSLNKRGLWNGYELRHEHNILCPKDCKQ